MIIITAKNSNLSSFDIREIMYKVQEFCQLPFFNFQFSFSRREIGFTCVTFLGLFSLYAFIKFVSHVSPPILARAPETLVLQIWWVFSAELQKNWSEGQVFGPHNTLNMDVVITPSKRIVLDWVSVSVTIQWVPLSHRLR